MTEEKWTKRAVLYARVSTKRQTEEGYSLRQQIGALPGWAEAQGYEVLVRQLDVELRGSGRSSEDA